MKCFRANPCRESQCCFHKLRASLEQEIRVIVGDAPSDDAAASVETAAAGLLQNAWTSDTGLLIRIRVLDKTRDPVVLDSPRSVIRFSTAARGTKQGQSPRMLPLHVALYGRIRCCFCLFPLPTPVFVASFFHPPWYSPKNVPNPSSTQAA